MADPIPYTGTRETHSAVIVFLGDRAYKVKKPVDLGFLDFTTRQARHQACLREVELNRRFAPDVYLGVADVHGPDGRVCDHLVVMRRLPDERRLTTLIRRGDDVGGVLRQVARLLAAAHARAPRGPEVEREGSRDALLGRWSDSFAQVRPFHGRLIDAALATEIERLTRRFLAGREALFDARIREGRVVDGHGDLLADDIFCLDDGPRVIDCLEFDDRLRRLDGLDDAAFLAMDLERLEAPELAERFMSYYVEYAADPAPAALHHHYVAYRAFVRAKVGCLRAAQGGDPTEVACYAQLALRHLRAGAVSLVLVGGLPGTGKTTLAGALADRLGFTLLSSDRVRKELAGLPAQAPAAAAYRHGIYAPDWTERVYAELRRRAGALLARGESVILDASWTSAAQRAATETLAKHAHADVTMLACTVDPATAAARMRSRRGGVSDADAAVATAMATDADAWPEATLISTDRPLEESLAQAAELVRPAAARPWRPRRSMLPPD